MPTWNLLPYTNLCEKLIPWLNLLSLWNISLSSLQLPPEICIHFWICLVNADHSRWNCQQLHPKPHRGLGLVSNYEWVKNPLPITGNIQIPLWLWTPLIIQQWPSYICSYYFVYTKTSALWAHQFGGEEWLSTAWNNSLLIYLVVINEFNCLKFFIALLTNFEALLWQLLKMFPLLHKQCSF